MPTSKDLLRSYVRLLHHLAGAEAVSLYFPGTPERPGQTRLVHDNGHCAVPELADPRTAKELLRSAAAEPARDEASGLLRPLPSRERGGWLLRVPAAARLLNPAPAAEAEAPRRKRRKADRRGVPDDAPALWIGLRLGAGGEELSLAGNEALWVRALAHGAAVAGYCQRVDTVLHDSVTELPGRADFQATLRHEVALALDGAVPLVLALLNPHDFVRVNERFGADAGDRVVQEIAARLKRALHSSEIVHRFGGVVFAVLLPATALPEGLAVVRKLQRRLTSERYLAGAIHLDFSCGLAGLEPADGGPDEAAWALIRRADSALSTAKVSPGGGIEAWQTGAEDKQEAHLDRLSGIFTADLAKDYRSMLLLWDTVELMNTAADPLELAARMVERLAATFGPDRAGLFRFGVDGRPELAASHVARRRRSGKPGKLSLSAAERALVEQARTEGKLSQGRFGDAGGGDGATSAHALPLEARGKTLG